MTNEDKTILIKILQEVRVSSLSVLIEGKPYVSLLPFAIQTDNNAAIVHASNMAKHSAGMSMDAPFSLLINYPDTPDSNPMALPRLSIQGNVLTLDKNSNEYDKSKNIYLTKFPDSRQFFDFGDFNLYQLNFKTARYVADFGHVYNLTTDSFKALVV